MERREEMPEVEGPRNRAGFTLRELIVSTAIIAFLLAITLPAINRAREEKRRATCINNEKQIGLGLQNFASAFQALPSACYTSLPEGTNKGKPGGFSFLVKISPFIFYRDNMPEVLLSPTDDPLDPKKDQQMTYYANNMPHNEFTCPGYKNYLVLAPSNLGRQLSVTNQAWAVTNYVALGASCPASLNIAINPTATPPYGTAAMHPDGTIYPTSSATGCRFADIPDGTSHTICVCETIDNIASAWTVGLDCVMTGMPD